MPTTFWYLSPLDSNLVIGALDVRTMSRARNTGAIPSVVNTPSAAGTAILPVAITGTQQLWAIRVGEYEATAGTYTFNHWCHETNAMANYRAAMLAVAVYDEAGNYKFDLCDGRDGSWASPTEYGTVSSVHQVSKTGIARSVANGDWLVFMPAHLPIGTGASGYTLPFGYAEDTAGASGDAWVSVPDVVPAYSAGPSLKTLTQTALLSVAGAVYAPGLSFTQPLTAAFLSSAEVLYAPVAIQTYPSQALTGVLLDAGQAVYAPDLTVGPASLSTALVTSVATLYAPGVAPDQFLTASFLSVTPAVYAPTLTALAVSLGVPLLTSASSLYGPTATVGAVGIGASFLDSGAALYAPSAEEGTGGAQVLAGVLLDAGAVLYDPVAAVGAVSVGFSLLTSTSVLYLPTATQFSAVQSLTGVLLTSAPVVNAPTAIQGAAGVMTVGVSFLTSTSALYAATGYQDQFLTAPFLFAIPDTYAPTAAQVSPSKSLTVPVLSVTAVTYAPTLAALAPTLQTPLLFTIPDLFSPSVVSLQWASVGLLTSTNAMYAPTVDRNAWLTMPFLFTFNDLFPPSAFDKRGELGEKLLIDTITAEFWPPRNRNRNVKAL